MSCQTSARPESAAPAQPTVVAEAAAQEPPDLGTEAVTFSPNEATLASCPETALPASAPEAVEPLSKPQPVVTSGPSESVILKSRPESNPAPLGTLFLELFAGTGRMSKAFSRVGLQVLAIDSVKVSGVPSLLLDLAKPLSQKLVLDLVKSRRLAAVHLAPPCGTSSQARSIYAGPGSPQPLRSAACPDGLPGLSFLQKHRVFTANKLYKFTAEVIAACQQHDVLWSVENPESSLFWLTSPMLELWRNFRRHIVFGTFDSCVYGGQRKKATTFWSNCLAVTDLSLRCHPSLGHVHLPWGRHASGWSTSEEAAYPPILCRHWASLVTEVLSRQGRIAHFGAFQGSVQYAAAERAALGLFPKATHAPVVVDPFQGHSWVRLESAKDRVKFVPGVRLQDPAFPKGSTTIKVMVEHGVWGALVGQPVSPEVFLQRAVASRHPQTQLPPLPPALDRTVSLLAGRKLSELHSLRCQRLKAMCDMATDLQAREDADHAGFAPYLQHILQGKRIRLFECLLQGLQYPDQSLPQDIRRGFQLTGWLPDTKTRPSKVIPPAMHRDEVWSHRIQNNSAVWALCKSSGDDSLDAALWQQTLEECRAGWAVLETGHTQAPACCILGRRFAVKQGNKIRPIDDLSVSLVNSYYASWRLAHLWALHDHVACCRFGCGL